MRTIVLAALLIFSVAIQVHAGTGKDSGKAVFQQNCILCHGEDGTGKTPPGTALGAHDLTSREVAKKTDAELMQTISQGRNKMPAFSEKLSDSQIHDVILYVRTLGKKE